MGNITTIYLFKHLFIYLSIYLSSMVRVFAHGAMDRRIDPSWWTLRAISRSSQCSTTGVTNAVVCAIVSVGRCVAAAGFLSRYLNGPLQ